MALVSDELMRKLEAKLEPGETVLWEGQPDAKRVAWDYSWFLPLLFMLAFISALAACTLSELGKWRIDWITVDGPGSPVILVIFVVIGLRMLAHPMIRYRRARSRVYAVTSDHIIIFEPLSKVALTKISIAHIGYITKSEHGDGYGSIAYASTVAARLAGETPDRAGIEQIHVPAEVEQLLFSLVAGSDTGAPGMLAESQPEIRTHDLTARNEILRELREGEQLIWYGRRVPNLQIDRDPIMVITGLIFVAGGCWGFFDKVLKHIDEPGFHWEAWLVAPFFAVFIILGALFALAPLFIRKQEASTYYAVTSQRAVIVCASSERTVKSFFPKDIETVKHVTNDEGLGDVTFADGELDTDGHPTPRIGFLNTPNSRKAESLLREMAERARG